MKKLHTHTHKAIRSTALGTTLLMTAALLAACGGGGGGTPTTAGSTGTSTAPANSGTLASPTYPAGSEQLAAFEQLNAMRQECGFPTLGENALLDQSVANHMTYVQLNKAEGHYETEGNPGFTGVNWQDRATYVGYPGHTGEVVAYDNSNSGGALSVVALASVPYHEALMFEPFSEVGIDYAAVVLGPASTQYSLLMDLGYQGANAPTFSSAPMTFPCQGSTDVDYESSAPENPAPLGIDTGTNPIGTPIAVIGNASDTIVLSSGQLTAPGGAVINMDLLDSSNDANHEMQPYEAAAFSASPLQPNTTYMATIVGTSNGNTFTKQFSFVTGNQGQF